MELSSEDILLLYSARRETGKKIGHKIEVLLKLELDWQYIREKAYQHGVAALLYNSLRRFDRNDLVPKEVMEELRKTYLLSGFLNAYLYSKLREILKTLQDAGVQVIVLKGAALAQPVYRDIALRPMVDLDLLVKEKDLPILKEKFSQLGYRSWDTDADWASLWRWWDYLPSYSKQDGLVTAIVDINLGAETLLNINSPREGFNPSRIDSKILWENPLPVKIAGVNALILSPETLLQYSSVHVIRHAYQGHPRLIWLCDTAELLKRYHGRIDWERVLQDSSSYKTAEFIYYALYLARKWLGAPIPAVVLDEVKPQALITSADDFCRAFIKEPGGLRVPEKEVRHLLQFLRTKGIGNRMQVVLRRFLQKKKPVLKHPTRPVDSDCFHYVVRFGRVVGMAIRALHWLCRIKFKT